MNPLPNRRRRWPGDAPRAPLRRGLLVPAIAAWFVSAAAAAADDRPNILVLMADNWAYPHASAYGTRVVHTPTFDRVARQGLLLHNTFCLAPSCAPARAAFLTGRTIHQLDEAASLQGLFPARFPVVTDALEAAGYTVGHSGKGWAPGNWQASGRSRNPAGPQFASAEAFFQQAPRDRPFFFWHSDRNPHIPWEDGASQKAAMRAGDVQVPAYLPNVPTVRENILDYYCEVQLFDRRCGEILEALRADGRLDNTLVIVTGDNGWQMPHGLAHIYDAGTRVPLAVMWPGRIKPGGVSHEFVNFDDFAPTFLAAAALEPLPKTTGRSLLPLWLGSKSWQPRDAVFLERERHANVRRGDRSYPVRAIRTADFLYVRNFEPDLWPAGDPQLWYSVGDFGDVDFTLTKQFLLQHRDDPDVRPYFEMNFGKRPAEELYDLAKDPDQTRNVAADPAYADALAALARRVNSWMRQSGDPRADNPHDDRWDRYPYFGVRKQPPPAAPIAAGLPPLKDPPD